MKLNLLAHEIAHITDRHIVEALRIRADDESTTAILGKMIGSGTGSASVIFQQAVDQALDLLFSKGLAIEDEVEADKQGIILSALAGYDPAAYYQYLERIKPIIENKNAQLGHTHPPVSERIDRLKQVIENEGLTSKGQYINRARFQQYQ